MHEWQYDNREFVIDIVFTDDGDYLVVRHPSSGHRLSPIRLRDLTKQERYRLREHLIEQLSEELRAAGIAPNPELQPGNGIKKAGKPRWSDATKETRIAS